MIRKKVKIHDTSSIEQKYWLDLDKSAKFNHYEIKSWIAAPINLEVNRTSFSRLKFYSTLKSYYRLVTPKYGIKYIVKESDSPFAHVGSAIEKLKKELSAENISEFKYHIKMYANIFKSSIRDRDVESDYKNDDFIEDVKAVVFAYGSLYESLKDIEQTVEPDQWKSIRKTYRNGEEYIIFLSMNWAYKLISTYPEMDVFIKDMIYYREGLGYKSVSKNDRAHNAEMIYKWSKLKKIHSSELFFTQDSKRDGVLLEQFYYSIAAGFSMVFATLIAFSFQRTYGSLTMPLFVALVVSYMLKDRIKEILRYYFAHKRNKKYFDNKIKIKIANTPIATSKEAFDFIPAANVPDFIKESIDTNYYQLSLYRKFINIDNKAIESHIEYAIEGINNIVRRDFSSYFSSMSNPTESIFCLDKDSNLKELETDRVYHFYQFIETRHNDKYEVSKYKIVANRLGLISIEEIH